MEALVVDASVLVHVLRRSEEGRRATRHLRDRGLVAPSHIDAEILHGLAGLARGGHLDEHRAAQARRRLVSLPMARFSIAPIVESACRLRHPLSLYDALYLALARMIGCPLLASIVALLRPPPVERRSRCSRDQQGQRFRRRCRRQEIRAANSSSSRKYLPCVRFRSSSDAAAKATTSTSP